ncbi:hypothetical protein [Streptomyces albireticuli]|uniref:hypothetical protein n=1 Tax=Streptomyces albireticuli TaxID=1940 RepID=UPI00118108DF|nr:hypothetical protein [Streptomyces albireticuli]MCD9196048.1 hypothetical protein [Streptomyces albireticuli]
MTRIIAEHGRTIASITGQPVATDLASFVEQVQDAVQIMDLGLAGHFRDDAESLGSAATYLVDAVGFDDDAPARAFLLGRASQHLADIDAADYL